MLSVNNWWSAVFVYLGVAKSAKIHFKDGEEFSLTKSNLSQFIIQVELATLPAGIKKYLKIKGKKVVLSMKNVHLNLSREAAGQIAGEFYYNWHNLVDVKGRDVLDVGAYVGDSTLYFVLAGRASHVYGFEPYKYYFDLAKKAVRDNNLGRKITMFRYAVGGRDSYGFINEESDDFMVDSSASSGSKKVKLVSLDTIAKRLNLKHAALKVDCEGCERSMINNASSSTLKRFDAIHIEYHYGYRDMVERLRREGYRVSYTKPSYTFKGISTKPMVMGDITATR